MATGRRRTRTRRVHGLRIAATRPMLLCDGDGCEQCHLYCCEPPSPPRATGSAVSAASRWRRRRRRNCGPRRRTGQGGGRPKAEDGPKVEDGQGRAVGCSGPGGRGATASRRRRLPRCASGSRAMESLMGLDSFHEGVETCLKACARPARRRGRGGARRWQRGRATYAERCAQCAPPVVGKLDHPALLPALLKESRRARGGGAQRRQRRCLGAEHGTGGDEGRVDGRGARAK